MGEADGDVQLAHALIVELDGLPLAVGGRAPAQVDRDVEDPPARAAHELGDAVADLEVHAAHDAARGARVVVLHELHLRRHAELAVPLVPVGLGEEAALVAVDGGLDHDKAGEAYGEGAHARQSVAVEAFSGGACASARGGRS